GAAIASFGSSGATRSLRSLSLNGVGKSGSMSSPISAPIAAIAVTIGEAGGREAEHDEIRLMLDHGVGELCRVGALAGDEAELLERLTQEVADVFLAVGDANARRDLAAAERGRGRYHFEHRSV